MDGTPDSRHEAADPGPADIDGGYLAVPDADDLWSPPSGTVPAPEPLLAALPLHMLAWEDFERLLVQLAREVDGLDDVRRYGKSGQEQHGIDVVGFTAGDRIALTYQGKDVERFGQYELRKAAEKFIEGKRPFGSRALRICTTKLMDLTQAQELLNSFEREHPDLSLKVWDAEVLNEFLRKRPLLVERFFGKPAADRFCPGGTRSGSPAGDSPPAELSISLVMRGPLKDLGLTQVVDQADGLVDDRPAEAAGLYAEAAASLRGSGYRSFSYQLLEKAGAAYFQAGRTEDGIGQLLELAGDQIWHGLRYSVQGTLANLRRAVGLSVFPPVQTEVPSLPDSARVKRIYTATIKLLSLANTLLDNPLPQNGIINDVSSAREHVLEIIGQLDEDAHLNEVPATSAIVSASISVHTILNYARVFDDIRLSAADSIFEELNRRLKQKNYDLSGDVALHNEMCLADMSEGSTGRWTRLYSAANEWAYTSRHTGFIYARYAARVTRDGQPELADDLYRRAIERAVEGNCFKEAAEWIEAREGLRRQFGQIWSDADDRMRMSRLLRQRRGESRADRVADLLSDAREELREGKLRAAALAAERAIAESSSNNFRVPERAGWELCADVLYRSGEPLAAALCAISSEHEKLCRETGSKFDSFVDVTSLMDQASIPRRIGAYSMLWSQADLIPDDLVNLIVRSTAQFSIELRTGSPRPVPFFGKSVFEVTLGLAGALARRASTSAVRWILDAFDSLDAREEGQHYRTDGAQLKVLGAALSQDDTSNRDRALTMLEALLRADTPDLSATDFRSAARKIPDLLANAFLPHVDRGSLLVSRICVELELAVPTALRAEASSLTLPEALHSAIERSAEKAGERFSKLEPGSPSTASFVAGLPSDALLASFLPVEKRAPIVERLVDLARDQFHPTSNRREFLISLELLARGALGDELGSETLGRLHQLGVRVASADTPRSPHEISSHPLSAFRMNWGPESLIGAGARLASEVARNDDQILEVDRLIASLPLRSLEPLQANDIASVIVSHPDGVEAASLTLQALGRLGTESLRAAAAVLWAKRVGRMAEGGASPEDVDLGVGLSGDESPLVRRSLAQALRAAKESGEALHPAVEAITDALANDRLYSVRRVLYDS